MPRYYVTMTLENWPQGELRKAVITAASPAEAQHLLRLREAERRVAAARAGQNGPGYSREMNRNWWLEHLAPQWHVVACLDVDELLAALSSAPDQLPVKLSDTTKMEIDGNVLAGEYCDRRAEVARIVAAVGRSVWLEAKALPRNWTSSELARHVGNRFLAHCLDPEHHLDPADDTGPDTA